MDYSNSGQGSAFNQFTSNSYVDSTSFWISTDCSCGLRYGST